MDEQLVVDGFGQPLVVGDEVVWANAQPGRGTRLDRCVVRGFTRTGQVQLEAIDTQRTRRTPFTGALVRVDVDQGDVEVGDLVVFAATYGSAFRVAAIGVVVEAKTKRLRVTSLAPAERGDRLVNRDAVLRVSPTEGERLRALWVANRAVRDATADQAAADQLMIYPWLATVDRGD